MNCFFLNVTVAPFSYVLPKKFGEGEHCISFEYNMYGEDIGELSVFRESGPFEGRKLWSMEGNQGPEWHRAEVTTVMGTDETVSMASFTLTSVNVITLAIFIQ